ncbi:MAG: hypothetical protein ICV79_25565 [Flavisolibacter sp.]|nr:hypothetical protein [Flavisolibacter sp.]
MLYAKSNALPVAETTLGKVKKVSKPIAKFVLHILELWLSMNCRYVFTNMQRWGARAEKSYRQMFAKFFDWLGFNVQLTRQHGSKEMICVFDPFFVKKSGKRTYGVGTFWSSGAGKALRRLEVGCLCFVDVVVGTALHALAEQTLSPKALKHKGKPLVNHYVRVINKQVKQIQKLTRYLAVDGYFMKRDFIAPLTAEGLQVITKMRRDANLRYLYRGPKKPGKGRPKLYDGR